MESAGSMSDRRISERLQEKRIEIRTRLEPLSEARENKRKRNGEISETACEAFSDFNSSLELVSQELSSNHFEEVMRFPIPQTEGTFVPTMITYEENEALKQIESQLSQQDSKMNEVIGMIRKIYDKSESENTKLRNEIAELRNSLNDEKSEVVCLKRKIEEIEETECKRDVKKLEHLVSKKDFKRARQKYEWIKLKKPNYPIPFTCQIELLMDEQDYLGALEKINERDHYSLTDMLYRAKIFYKLKKYEQAIQDYLFIISSFSDELQSLSKERQANLYVFLGIAYFNKKDIPNAHKYIEIGLKLDPNMEAGKEYQRRLKKYIHK